MPFQKQEDDADKMLRAIGKAALGQIVSGVFAALETPLKSKNQIFHYIAELGRSSCVASLG